MACINQKDFYTMPIIRTKHIANFTITPNAVCNEGLSLEAVGLWDYFIRKPPHWKFNATAVKHKFGIGFNKVYRIMRELIEAGYATCKRIQSGTIWTIYDTPQNRPENVKTATAPVESHRVNFERVENECVLESTESLEIIKQQHELALIDQQKAVVVFLKEEQPDTVTIPDPVSPGLIEVDELVFPTQLDDVQKKQAKVALKKLKKPELADAILLQLADILLNNKLKKTLGAYFNWAVGEANTTGIFDAPKAADKAKPDRRHIDDTAARLDAQRAADAKPKNEAIRKAFFNKTLQGAML